MDNEEQNNKINNDYDQVRALLLGLEKQQIEEILERLNNPKILSDEISNILPEAIRLGLTKGDRLHRSLIPVISKAIKENAENDPHTLINIIYSIIGPATRKAVAEALKSMMQSLNSAMNNVFSINGIKWRFQSIVTKKPFSEIVLLHNLIYQIEQVFFIHKNTSLLIEEAKLETATSNDPDLISSMLRAIQDFVKDSFKLKTGESLNTLNVGELTVWIEEGPNAVLAAVVRGEAPESLRSNLTKVSEKIHKEYWNELNNFDGDTAPFVSIKSDLESCLFQQLQTETKPKPKFTQFILILLAILLVVGGFFWIRDLIRWNGYIDRLKQEKGIVIIDEGGCFGNKYIKGLRDPLSIDPLTVTKEYNLEPEDIKFNLEPYQSLNSEIIIKRAEKFLNPTKFISLQLKNDTLFGIGFATDEWVENAKIQAKALSGVNYFNTQRLKKSYGVESDSLILIIENMNFLFQYNSLKLVVNQVDKFDTLMNAINSLVNINKNKIIHIDILGHSDSSGTEERNEKLSWKRAKVIFDSLTDKKIKGLNFSLNAMGNRDPFIEETKDINKTLNRRVNMKIKINSR